MSLFQVSGDRKKVRVAFNKMTLFCAPLERIKITGDGPAAKITCGDHVLSVAGDTFTYSSGSHQLTLIDPSMSEAYAHLLKDITNVGLNVDKLADENKELKKEIELLKARNAALTTELECHPDGAYILDVVTKRFESGDYKI